MAVSWPTSQDSTSTFPTDVTEDTDSKTGTPRTGVQSFHAALHRDTDLAILALEGELGNLPKGAYASVRERLEARDLKDSCRAATTAALPAATYNNGSSGVGAALTANANGALAAQDGVTLSVGDRLFVKDQAALAQNGPYTVTALGSGAAPWVLTRATDSDTAVKLSDSTIVSVEQGAAHRDTGWELVTDNPITVGTTALRYTRIWPEYGGGVGVSGPASRLYLPTTAMIESCPRHQGGFGTRGVLTSGVLWLNPLGVLRAGDTLSSITWLSSGAGATLTNQWAGIVRVSDLKLVAVSATDGATAWAANAAKKFVFGTGGNAGVPTTAIPYTADKDELLFGALMVAATTVPTLIGPGSAAAANGSPRIGGASNTGQTTPMAVGTTVTAPTADPANFGYCYAS